MYITPISCLISGSSSLSKFFLSQKPIATGKIKRMIAKRIVIEELIISPVVAKVSYKMVRRKKFTFFVLIRTHITSIVYVPAIV